MTLQALDASELIRVLERARPRETAAGIAFDADGTLWWGDVAEDVLVYATSRALIRQEARPALAAAAAKRGVSTGGSPSDLVTRIFEAYLSGAYPEREVCEVMTWCYAGYTRAELVEITRDALTLRDFADRQNLALRAVIDWARGAGLQTIVVSASPQPIVEFAVSAWGFAPAEVAASTVALEAGRIAPRMGGRLPYAADKRDAGRRLLRSAFWLASFGDSEFDFEMLAAAEFGVAVNPKPGLRARLEELQRAVLLG